MNKKDKERIRSIILKKVNSLEQYAGVMALEGYAEEDDTDFYRDEIERAFWDIHNLYDLRDELLNESN